MNILLIVIGAILLLICGSTCLATHTATKNQANWDECYKIIEEKNLPVSEEVVYNLVCKMKFWFGIGLILGLALLTSGIILQITFK